MGDEGEDNVGDGQESVREAGRSGDIVLDVIGGLNGDGNHGDNSGDQDTDSGDGGHHEDLARGTRKRSDGACNQSDHSEDDGTGAVVCDGVERHGECEDVTGHQEDDKQKLANIANFASNGAHKKFTSVSHAVDLGVAQLELTHDIACIP